jgi:hypothetical protein
VNSEVQQPSAQIIGYEMKCWGSISGRDKMVSLCYLTQSDTRVHSTYFPIWTEEYFLRIKAAEG